MVLKLMAILVLVKDCHKYASATSNEWYKCLCNWLYKAGPGAT